MTLLQLESDLEFKSVYEMYENYVQDMNALRELKSTELVSFVNSYIEIYRKIFVIACANSFEKHFCRKLPEILSENVLLQNFITKQALDRKYHMLFRWEGNNANTFYGLFGEGFKEEMQIYLQEFDDLKEGEKSFLQIGHYRNLTAHKGFDSSHFLEDIDAIKLQFDKALLFYKNLLNLILLNT